MKKSKKYILNLLIILFVFIIMNYTSYAGYVDGFATYNVYPEDWEYGNYNDMRVIQVETNNTMGESFRVYDPIEFWETYDYINNETDHTTQDPLGIMMHFYPDTDDSYSAFVEGEYVIGDIHIDSSGYGDDKAHYSINVLN